MRGAKAILPVLPVAFLVACGGSSDEPKQEVTVFPIEAAVVAYLNSPRSFTANYTDTATSTAYTLAYSHTAAADASFENNAAKQVKLTMDLKGNGVPILTSSQDDYYQMSPFKYLGTIADTGEYTVATNQGTLPATAKAGDHGNLYNATTYADSTKATTIETTVANWEVQADTASTAYFCVNSTVTPSDETAAISGSECYKIDTNGKVIGNKITFPGATGKPITFVG